MKIQELRRLLSNEHVKVILYEMSKLNNEDFSLFIQLLKDTESFFSNFVDVLFSWFYKTEKK